MPGVTTPSFQTPEQRRKAVALVVALTANTRLAPERYDRHLPDRFERGELTLDGMEALLDARVHQVLYHRHATASCSEADLQDLLNRSGR